ncbi:MAG: Rpn family recombination-promoting nuclease/putative transposase [Treponemataceae bacterium]
MNNKENELWKKKPFDDLTIADDFMFCVVMQEEDVCLQLLNIVLKNEVGKLIQIIPQDTVEGKSNAKGVRLDIMAEEDSAGKLYNIEMQTAQQHFLAKRMRYYQCAIDQSSLDKGADYIDLPETFIIFFCTFDHLKKSRPLYTIKPICEETAEVFNDGTTKLIVNTKASEKAEPELRALLQYMNGMPATSEFTKKLDEKVKAIKQNETRRKEYMNITAFEMDARRDGITIGLLEGRKEGLVEGLNQGKLEKARETARNLLEIGLSVEQISKVTGLSESEIDEL